MGAIVEPISLNEKTGAGLRRINVRTAEADYPSKQTDISFVFAANPPKAVPV